jgi:hypothetical protein
VENLIKPSEYAKELGISRQAVYAKIKKGILEAKEVDGQLYIINAERQVNQTNTTSTSTTPTSQTTTRSRVQQRSTATKTTNGRVTAETISHYRELIASKNETIVVLKGTVKDLKKSNKHISKTLRGEINLLKEAFHEMRTLYKHKIEHMKERPCKFQESEEVSQPFSTQTNHDAIDVDSIEPEQAQAFASWVSAKKFLREKNITNKEEQDRILKILRKAFKKGDARFSVIDGKLKLDINKSYGDIFKV